MKAVAFGQSLPIDHPEALVDLTLPTPRPGPRDLLVSVEAVSVNPVDTKVRVLLPPDEGELRVLGWDAVGTVVAVGDEVRSAQPGQRVWYAGALDRPGSNSELQLVDERLASPAPRSLAPLEAAALPLTSITAWELLFERLRLPVGKAPTRDVLLVSGAAGGVGSILVQLAARLTSATVIATAGSPESEEWVRELGAHHVISYRQPLGPQLEALGLGPLTHVASLTHTEQYFAALTELMAPGGQIAIIDDPGSLDIALLKPKSLGFHWEFMFTRSLFQADDMDQQRTILTEVARLVDAGLVRSTARTRLGPMSAATLRQAHELIESGGSRGKVVLQGFDH